MSAKPFRIILLFLITVAFTMQAGGRQNNNRQDNPAINISSDQLAGQYRLKYYPTLKSKKHSITSGWDYDQLHREELLILNADSTYIIKRIHPQGGFEVLPDKGIWKYVNGSIILQSSLVPRTYEPGKISMRKFKPTENGLIEPTCAEKKLSGQLWAKE